MNAAKQSPPAATGGLMNRQSLGAFDTPKNSVARLTLQAGPCALARDAEQIACGAIGELAASLCEQANALEAAAKTADIGAVEARLWCLRRILTTAIGAWREAVPAIDSREPAT